MNSGRLDVAEAPYRTLGVVDFSGKALHSLGTRHHPDESQILTTTDALHFPTYRSLRKKVGKVNILRLRTL